MISKELTTVLNKITKRLTGISCTDSNDGILLDMFIHIYVFLTHIHYIKFYIALSDIGDREKKKT